MLPTSASLCTARTKLHSDEIQTHADCEQRHANTAKIRSSVCFALTKFDTDLNVHSLMKTRIQFLVQGQETIIFVVSVGLSVCLFVQFFSAVFDPISIKLGHMLYVCV